MKLRSKHKIISITVTHAHILLNTGETTKVALNELSFKPKVNDIVEVYQNKDQIIVMKVREKRKPWIYTVIVTIVALVIGGTSLWFLNHRDDSTQVVTKQSSSKKNTSEFSYRSSSSNSSSSSSEPEAPVIETSAEALRDMENDGTLKTGQRYRFTAELFRQSEWADYSGHFKKLNPYYSIWVKASNAPISGIEIQIMKSLTTGWTEGMKITFTVKIMEDSEKFQFWWSQKLYQHQHQNYSNKKVHHNQRYRVLIPMQSYEETIQALQEFGKMHQGNKLSLIIKGW